ncbi:MULTISPECIES: right-handed parallel beta-helix repeat-containing protein [unclassified Streptomyces]|uniref:right-handed parallel beta-helix repeat-containing protein n=1 Tax=unclassified Streptomyces TaxID=2593676 RepID=UPI002E22E904|nr:right-handed parallel beta-helix repeat-containing protein [Streptomyces sp. NBC_01023]
MRTVLAQLRRARAAVPLTLAVTAASVLFPAGAAVAGGPPAVVLHAARDGSGTACARSHPCSVGSAQDRVRELLGQGPARDVVVELADGTYRLDKPLEFGPQDSGRPGHRVTWTAAPGAHPVLSGARKVTGWKLRDADKNVWEAPLPKGLDTRQVYVDGRRAPVAQTTPAELELAFAAASGGYTTTPAAWGQDLLAALGPAALSRVEFVYTGGNGPWTQSRCRLDTVRDSTLLIQQPCWGNITKRPAFTQASGSLPSMNPGTPPTRIENAYPFLHAGQWYVDPARGVLDYVPAPGQDITALDVEVPRLSTLVKGAGTLDAPVRNLTFSGLTFAYATWLDPSSRAGFADVQDNLRLTGDDPAHPQGTCTFGTPPGTCPFGALSREPGNVQFTAAHDVVLLGNTFTHLGAAGLVLEHGSRDNTVEGNTFADISGNGIILGNTTDPHPSDVGADDREISSGNTLADNLIHDAGTDYPSAAGITLFFTQHTLVTHNELRDLPYTGITAGVIQGHVDNAAHPENSTNINSDNTISNNLIHRYMQVLKDGGAVYVEGHQGQTRQAADGSVDRAASVAHGLTVAGNVAYDQGNVNFTWYDDAGAQWLNWTGNLEWGAKQAQGGCQTTGHLDYTGNVQSGLTGEFHCSPPVPVDTRIEGNRAISPTPSAADLPADTVSRAGLTGRWQTLTTSLPPGIGYAHVSPDGAGVLVAGHGFAPDTRVSLDGVPATKVTVLSNGFLDVVPPSGTHPRQITVTTPHGTTTAALG